MNVIGLPIISQLLISCQNNNSEYINQIEKLKNELEECSNLVQEADSIKQAEEVRRTTETSLNNSNLENTQEKEIVPVNQAEISDVHFHLGEHFSFTAKFEVEPDFKLPRFKKKMFQVQRNKFIPYDQDINDAIDQLRRSHARIETVEDGAPSEHFPSHRW